MEKEGILVDRHILSRLVHDFAQTMARLEDEIATIAGEPFNIGSPKQLGEILFDKMAIPGGAQDQDRRLVRRCRRARGACRRRSRAAGGGFSTGVRCRS